MDKKVALVTGASSGIGLAIALKFAAHGYAVLATGRDEKRTQEIVTQNQNIRTWIGDLTTSEACGTLIDACVQGFGGLDVLVNNAGIYSPSDAENTSDAAWLQTMAINLNAPFYLSRAAIPYLRRTKGVILNIASDWGLVGGKKAAAYCASKGGLVLLTKAMSCDHAGEGIRVNAICPGDVETPMLLKEGAVRGADQATALREANEASPTGRVTTPDEVASLALFLASDAAKQITGAALPIDGGNTA